MAPPHIAYYFPDREALVEGAVRLAVETGQSYTIAHLQKAKSTEEGLAAIVHGAFDWLEANPRYFSMMMLFYFLASYDERYLALHTELRAEGEKRIASLLEKSGKFPDKKARLQRTRDIHGLITGNVIGWATTKSKAPLSEARKRTVETVLELSRPA
jgi:AcrR family transcriptional regulator